MALDFIESLREFFSDLASKITLSSVILFLFGLLSGMLLVILIYAIFLTNSIKAGYKKDSVNGLGNTELKAREYISSSIAQYEEESEGLKASERINLAYEISLSNANNIAKLYYPKSNYPLYELSVEELIILDYYIAGRIETLLDGKVTKKFKSLKLSTVFNLMDAKRRIDNNKIVKEIEKSKIVDISGAVLKGLNIINPLYWIRRGVSKVSIEQGLNKILKNIINIVLEEVNKIYSKSIFKEDDMISDEDIKELEEKIKLEGDKNAK